MPESEVAGPSLEDLQKASDGVRAPLEPLPAATTSVEPGPQVNIPTGGVPSGIEQKPGGILGKITGFIHKK